MAIKRYTFKNLSVELDGVQIGCADSISLECQADMADLTCKDSVGWREVIPDEKSWAISVDGVISSYTSPDASTNKGYFDFMALYIAATQVDVSFGGIEDAETRYAGKAYIGSLNGSAARKGKGTYAIKFEGDGALSATILDLTP